MARDNERSRHFSDAQRLGVRNAFTSAARDS